MSSPPNLLNPYNWLKASAQGCDKGKQYFLIKRKGWRNILGLGKDLGKLLGKVCTRNIGDNQQVNLRFRQSGNDCHFFINFCLAAAVPSDVSSEGIGVGICNPLCFHGSQTLTLYNGRLQISRDERSLTQILSYGVFFSPRWKNVLTAMIKLSHRDEKIVSSRRENITNMSNCDEKMKRNCPKERTHYKKLICPFE